MDLATARQMVAYCPDHEGEVLGPPPRAEVAGDLGWPGAEVVEVPLLLPGWLAAALEKAAGDQGLTVTELVRRLLPGLRSQVADRHPHARVRAGARDAEPDSPSAARDRDDPALERAHARSPRQRSRLSLKRVPLGEQPLAVRR